jgi:glycosyltransferase involved in cell wall biosynthesis
VKSGEKKSGETIFFSIPFSSARGGLEIAVADAAAEISKFSRPRLFTASRFLKEEFRARKIPAHRIFLEKINPVSKLAILLFPFSAISIFLPGFFILLFAKLRGARRAVFVNFAEKILLAPLAQLLNFQTFFLEHETPRRWFRRNPFLPFYKFAARRATVIFPSQFLRDEFLKICPNLKTGILPNKVEPEFSGVSWRAARKVLDLSSRKISEKIKTVFPENSEGIYPESGNDSAEWKLNSDPGYFSSKNSGATQFENSNSENSEQNLTAENKDVIPEKNSQNFLSGIRAANFDREKTQTPDNFSAKNFRGDTKYFAEKNSNSHSEFISESKFQNRGEIPNQVRDDKVGVRDDKVGVRDDKVGVRGNEVRKVENAPRGDFDLIKLGGVSKKTKVGLQNVARGKIENENTPRGDFAEMKATLANVASGGVSDSQIHRPFFLSTAGADRLHKNLRNLIRAFAIFDRKNPGAANLVLTGKISPDLKKFIAAQNLPNIFYPGFLPEKKLKEILRAARAFVFPSRSEGFGIPVLEAQNFSVPIAAANSTALPEIAGTGAVFFNPEKPEEIATKMEKIFFDEKLREKLIVAGKENLKRFSWDRSIEKCAKVLKSI